MIDSVFRAVAIKPATKRRFLNVALFAPIDLSASCCILVNEHKTVLDFLQVSRLKNAHRLQLEIMVHPSVVLHCQVEIGMAVHVVAHALASVSNEGIRRSVLPHPGKVSIISRP